MAAPSYAEMVERARALVPALRERAPRAEALRRIPDETVADLHKSGLWTAFRPARYGGSEIPARGYVELGAILASGCASTSWVYNNLVSHNWMLGYWPPEAQNDVWSADPEALVGSGLVMAEGEVTRTKSGWRIKGRWPFSSGIDPASWVMLGGRVAAADGAAPIPHLFLVPRSDCRVIDTWQAMGLGGTGSKDVTVADASVPAHRAMPVAVGNGGPHPGSVVNPGPVYRLAWYSIFSFVNAGTPLGIAEGAVRDFAQSVRARAATYSGKALAELATLQMRLAEAATLVDAAMTIALKDCDEAMALAEQGLVPPLIDRARWRRDGAYAAQLAARAVDIVFAGTGGSAIHEAHPLQRALRDVHAANGHIGVSWDLNGGIYGRMALGLAPDFPL
jgi:3-hydroxy-9,10-secoandrosta-1,3,5(10)-triene-9,17-dione monooxygenase